eukprot:2494602-Alexandrium_andersonii.AAC.1
MAPALQLSRSDESLFAAAFPGHPSPGCLQDNFERLMEEAAADDAALDQRLTHGKPDGLVQPD